MCLRRTLRGLVLSENRDQQLLRSRRIPLVIAQLQMRYAESLPRRAEWPGYCPAPPFDG